jgi:hypothetical protein
MGITALIVGGLGAAGAVGSSMIQSNAAQNASNQQVALGEQGLAQQQKMFQTAQNTLLPYTNAGASILPTLQSLITPGPNQNALLSQTPGFQFASQYGTMAATNALASRGLGASAGPVATAVSGYNQGLAQNTWQSVVNALQGYAGMGANAAGQLASGAIQSGNAQAGTLSNIGTSMAAGTLGSANALAGGLSGITNSLSSAALLGGMGSGGGLYGNIGNMPATGAGSPNALQSNLYAISQGINPFSAATGGHSSGKGKQPILVGENGPELFVPDQAGTIVPYDRIKKAMKDKNCLTTRGLTRKLGEAA